MARSRSIQFPIYSNRSILSTLLTSIATAFNSICTLKAVRRIDKAIINTPRYISPDLLIYSSDSTLTLPSDGRMRRVLKAMLPQKIIQFTSIGRDKELLILPNDCSIYHKSSEVRSYYRSDVKGGRVWLSQVSQLAFTSVVCLVGGFWVGSSI